jgi:hypothetical protein
MRRNDVPWRGERALVARVACALTLLGVSACVPHLGAYDEAATPTRGLTDAGGVIGAPTGGAGGSSEEPVVHKWVHLEDTSEHENQNGTPGVDICGVEVNCDGASLVPISTRLSAGSGWICVEGEEGCSADRNDPDAAADDGTTCDPSSRPSDYVSVGVGGELWLEMDRDLVGCNVTVVELVGGDAEGYTVRVCSEDRAGAGCILAGTSPSGGEASFEVPSADE